MRKIILENVSTLKDSEVVITFVNIKHQHAPMMLLVTKYSNGEFSYGFMNASNPLLSERQYTSSDKQESISKAIRDGHQIYVAENINELVYAKLRELTEFLLFELSLNQYPKDTVRATTEMFITERLQ